MTQKMMSLVPALLALSSAFSPMSYADGVYDVFNGMNLSVNCQDRIVDAAVNYCNNESLKDEGKDRMNPCIDFESDIVASGQYQGQIEIGGAAGDADVYWYTVSILDASSCKYRLNSEQADR